MDATILADEGYWVFSDLVDYCMYGGPGCRAKQFTDPNPAYPTKTYKEVM